MNPLAADLDFEIFWFEAEHGMPGGIEHPRVNEDAGDVDGFGASRLLGGEHCPRAQDERDERHQVVPEANPASRIAGVRMFELEPAPDCPNT